MVHVDMGDFFDDVGAWIRDATAEILKPYNDVLDQAPWLKDAIDSGSDAFKKFAKSAEGQTILRALATALYASTVVATGGVFGVFGFGPQLASAVFALPGIAKGDSFDKSWIEEFTWRLSETAQIVAADPGLQSQIGASLPESMQNLGASFQAQVQKGAATFTDAIAKTGLPLDELAAHFGWTPESLAAQLGIRVDVAAALLNFAAKQDEYPLSDYDPVSGQKRAALAASTVSRAQAIHQAAAARVEAQFANVSRAQAIHSAAAARAEAATAGEGPARLVLPGIDTGDMPPRARALVVGGALVVVGAGVWGLWKIGVLKRWLPR